MAKTKFNSSMEPNALSNIYTLVIASGHSLHPHKHSSKMRSSSSCIMAQIYLVHHLPSSFIITLLFPSLAFFYVFTTVDGSQVRITERHFIPVYDDKQHQVKVIRASFVQPEHYLLMNNKTVAIRTISTQTAVGFYAPLTLSGYLTVNGISTAVFSDWLVMHLSFCCAVNVCVYV